jgi:flagellar hook protein FlgE
VAFTRAGSFRPDEEGFLRNSAGYYLQGWALDNNGAYVNTGNLAALTPVRVGELTGTATATTRLQMRANLQSTTAAFTGTYAAGDMATGTVTPAFSRSLDIFDAQGGPHRINLSFLKTAPNTWAAEIYASPASDVTATNGLLASGTIAFNPDGSLDVANSSAALFGTVTPVWTNSAAADPIQLELAHRAVSTASRNSAAPAR